MVREQGTPTVYSLPQISPVSFIFRRPRDSPISLQKYQIRYKIRVTTWPITVAMAAPFTSRRGMGPSPKIKTGSRMILVIQPAAIQTMGTSMFPTA